MAKMITSSAYGSRRWRFLLIELGLCLSHDARRESEALKVDRDLPAMASHAANRSMSWIRSRTIALFPPSTKTKLPSFLYGSGRCCSLAGSLAAAFAGLAPLFFNAVAVPPFDPAAALDWR